MKNKYRVMGKTTKLLIEYHGQEMEALIDTDDLEMVSKASSWFARYDHGTDQFYVHGYFPKDHDLKIAARAASLHRYLMDFPEGMVVHHVNHKPLDNRKSNLQVMTRSENSSLQPEKKRQTLNLDFNRTLLNIAIRKDVKETLIYMASAKRMNLEAYINKVLLEHTEPLMAEFVGEIFRISGKRGGLSG